MTDRELTYLGAALLASSGIDLDDALVDAQILLRAVDAMKRSRYRSHTGPDEETIRAALEDCAGNVLRTALKLEMSRTWLNYRIKRLGIDPSVYRKASGVSA